MPSVTLVIKTPSLKLSDLTYSCEVTQTVHNLKLYLQTQYPSKPKPDEQRLIYQGRLLADSEVFQDFLRELDTEQRHTLHLVYALKRSLSVENREQANMQPADIAPEDGLRLRNTPQAPPQQEWVVTNGQLNGQFPLAPLADPVTQQLLWWQQTYAQQYWAHYMHHMSNQAATPIVPAPAPEPVQQEPQRRPPLAAVGGVAQEDDEDGVRVARDWLDWIYVGSRLAILLGVMYYYSSLPRFMLVTVIVAGIYLYQKAVHQRRVQPVEPVPAVEEPAAQPQPQTNNITPTGINVAVNLLIGFFTSLIPEVPAPEALN